jgi:geranylgeranyl diphosphate synthase, type II
MLEKNRNRGSGTKGAFDLQTFLAAGTKAVNEALDGFIPPSSAKPGTIHRAMRYSLFAGGKRLRPALCLAASAACGGKPADTLPLACAVECTTTIIAGAN